MNILLKVLHKRIRKAICIQRTFMVRYTISSDINPLVTFSFALHVTSLPWSALEILEILMLLPEDWNLEPVAGLLSKVQLYDITIPWSLGTVVDVAEHVNITLLLTGGSAPVCCSCTVGLPTMSYFILLFIYLFCIIWCIRIALGSLPNPDRLSIVI